MPNSFSNSPCSKNSSANICAHLLAELKGLAYVINIRTMFDVLKETYAITDVSTFNKCST
jgi:hypothetical protein